MRKSVGSMFAFNRNVFLLLGVVLSLAAFSVGTWRTGAQATRTIRAVSITAQPGQTATMAFELVSQGNEASTSFTVNFDPTRLSNPVAVLGSGAPANSAVNTNPNEIAMGRLGVLVDSTNAYTAGTRQIMTITFNVAANAPNGAIPITFSGSPTIQSVGDVNGILQTTVYQPGNITIGSGPTPTPTVTPTPTATPTPTPTPAAGRIIRAVSTGTQPGLMVTVSFQLDAQGDESSTSFTVNFDPTKLSNPVAALGSGVPAGSNLGTNTNEVAMGRLGILIDSTNTYAMGTRQILTVTFNVAGNAPFGLTPISFGGTPTIQSVSNANGVLLPTTYQTGNVAIGSTAAGVRVSGRVTTPDGRGLRNAVVSITDSDGFRRTATTSSFGFYAFDEVEAGGVYVVGVAAKRYRFAARVLQVADTLADVDFIGQE